MKSNRSVVFPGLFLATLVLWQCDTALNVKQPETSYFIKYFGNERSQTGRDFVVNPDGTFILFGTTQVGKSDTPRFYLAKADANGNFLWEQTFGTGWCQARDIELANDGRIVVLGNMTAPGRTDYDVFLKTFLPDGTPKDEMPLTGYQDFNNGLQPAADDASTVTQTYDGFIVAGSSANIAHPGDPSFIRDPFFLRLNDDLGAYQGTWTLVPAFGQGVENLATKIVQLPDSSFYVFGYTKYNGGPQTDFDYWYFALSKTAGTQGGVNYLGTPGRDEKLFSVSVDTTSLGTGFLLAGLENDPTGDRIFIARLHHPPLDFLDGDAGFFPPTFLGISLGIVNTVLDPPYPANEFVSVRATLNSDFLILTNEVTSNNSNILLTRIDGNSGIPRWTPVIFGGQGDDFAGSVQELSDGKIAIIGTMTIGQASVNNRETKMVLIKVNQDGQFGN